MPFVPKVICGTCNIPMKCSRQGVTLDAHVRSLAMLEEGRLRGSYYVIESDRYSCSRCGACVYTGFGQPTEHYQPEHARRQKMATVIVDLEPDEFR